MECEECYSIMNGWLMIWILFILGFFPLGYGIYILTNRNLREKKDQRTAGIAFIIIGLVMISPVLWMLIPLLLHTKRIV